MRLAAPYVLAAASGALLPLAFAPFHQFWIAPLAYAVLLYVWSGAAPRRAFALGFVFGAASFGGGTYWTYIAVREFGEAPFALAAFLTVGLVLILSAFVGAAGWLAARYCRTRGALAWLLVLPSAFVLTEWLRGWVLSGFGWLAAGYSQTDSWLMGLAPVGGVHALSFAVLVTAGALVTLAFGTLRGRVAAACAAAAVWAAGYAAGAHAWTQPKDRVLSAALVQGAVAQDLKWRPEQLPGTLALYGGLTQQSFGADLIVWPEAALPTLYEYVEEYLGKLRDAAAARGSTVLLGILRSDPAAGDAQAFQNVLVGLTQEPQFYVKRHLVPFGEYFPVPDFIRNWMRLMSLPYTDAVPGDDDQPPLDAAGERIAITICYEDVFGAEQLHYLPEATLLVNVSNDAWFGDSIAPHQHLQIAQVRAAEAGRWLLRATNTGVTAAIDPRGTVTETLPQFTAGVLTHEVRGYTGATPYARVGNYPLVLLVLAGLVAGSPAAAALAARRTRGARRAHDARGRSAS